MSKNTISTGWVSGLDTIRFSLAVIVLLGHSNIFAPLDRLDDGSASFRFFRFLIANSFVGVAAVIAFFIISGIVIHYPYRHGKEIFVKEFLLKRYLRVGLPMIIIAGLAYALGISDSDLPFWSLYCELIYYTLYPFIIFITRKYKLSLNQWIVVGFILSYLLLILHGEDISIFINQEKLKTTNYHHLGIYWTWLLGLPCWLLGVKIAEQYDLIKVRKISFYKILMVRLLTFLASMLCSMAHFHLAFSYSLSLGIFSLLASYWITSEIIYWNSTSPISILERGGKWSYSIYLCHMIPIAYVRNHGGTSSFSIAIYQIIGAFLISYVFYALIEKPSHQLIRKISFNNGTSDKSKFVNKNITS